MFTGIITDVGTLRAVERGAQSEWGDTRMFVNCMYDVDSIDIGASISHSGACMTIVEKGKDGTQNWYAFDVSDESLDKTTLSDWTAGQKINLERALTGADELGGHLVTGHVDGTGRVMKISRMAGSLKIDIEVQASMMAAIAPKGSITVDGVSLTVNDVETGQFSVNIIPHTAKVTTLGNLRNGDKVNLEIDLIARYVANYLSHMKG